MAAPNVPLMMRIMREKPGWCDDGGTRQTETCEDQIAARARPRARLDRAPPGPDIDKWQWGSEHFAAHRHPLFDAVPLLRDIASVRFPSDGGAHTLNRAHPSLPRRAAVRCRASARAIAASTISATSTTAASPCRSASRATCSRAWARNFVDSWQSLGYVEISGTRAEVGRTAIGTITLSPPNR